MWLLLACTALTPRDTQRPDTGITDTDIPDNPLPSGLTVLDHVAIVDADGRRDNRAVLLLDSRIERVTEAGREWPADADVIDATGLTVIPGLVDSHVHLATAGTTEPVGDMLEVNLRATLAAGVTEVVDLGGPVSLFALRDAIDRGDAIGPRIHAVHLRSVQHTADGVFYEANHLEGSMDMPAVVRALLTEQAARRAAQQGNRPQRAGLSFREPQLGDYCRERERKEHHVEGVEGPAHRGGDERAARLRRRDAPPAHQAGVGGSDR